MSVRPSSGARASVPYSAETLPAAWYVDPEVFELEERLIFQRTWQFVGLAGDIPEPGDHFTHRVGRTPVIVVRDRDARVHVFVNACRHRGAEIVAPGSCGRRAVLQCPYHAWTYALDGRLKGVPRKASNPDFDPSGIALVSLRTEQLGPLIFANADPDAPSLADVLGPWYEELGRRGIAFDPSLKARLKVDYDVEANWKINCDNGPECYHCPTVHPSLLERRNGKRIEDFEYEFSEHFSIHHFPRDPEFVPGYGFRGGPPELSFVLPNLFPTMWPDGFMAMVQIFPLSPTRSIYHRQYWVADGPDPEERTRSLDEYRDFLETLDVEDVAIAESVQRGMTSGLYDRGHLMLPNSDAAIKWFQDSVRAALAEAVR